jgi:hypothetical protein
VYDRSQSGLAEESEAEEQVIEAVTQPEVVPPAQPKRSRRKQGIVDRGSAGGEQSPPVFP